MWVCVFFALLTGGIGLTVAAPMPPVFESKHAPAKNTLKRSLLTMPASLDPARFTAINECIVMSDLFEGLTTVTPDGKLHPGIATHWTTSNNGKKWRFYLRKTARWSDGVPLTAHDFVYSFQRLVAPLTRSPHTDIVTLTNITNTSAIIESHTHTDNLGIKAPDDHTLDIQLDSPALHLPELLSSCYFFPVPRHTIKACNDLSPGKAAFVSNGPFALKSIASNQITLLKNPYYYNEHNVHVDEVHYIKLASSHAEMQAFFQGDIDITSSVPSDSISYLKRNYPHMLMTVPVHAIAFLSLNTRESALGNPFLRQALSMALDRHALTQQISSDTAQATATLSPGTKEPDWFYWPRTKRHSMARHLYARAGYSKAHPLQLTLSYPTQPDNHRLMLAIMAMWKQVLGINVTVVSKAWPAYINDRVKKKYTITKSGFAAIAMNDPAILLTLMMSSSHHNTTGYASKRYDNLVYSGVTASRPTEKHNYYQKAAQLLQQDVPVIPLYNPASLQLVGSHIKGFIPSAIMTRNRSAWFTIERSGDKITGQHKENNISKHQNHDDIFDKTK